LDKARESADVDQRAQLEAQADRLITDQMVWIPLVEQHNSVILRKAITGVPASIYGYMSGPWSRTLGKAGK
jgi:ABC-type transport system substrate-binding protein